MAYDTDAVFFLPGIKLFLIQLVLLKVLRTSGGAEGQEKKKAICPSLIGFCTVTVYVGKERRFFGSMIPIVSDAGRVCKEEEEFNKWVLFKRAILVILSSRYTPVCEIIRSHSKVIRFVMDIGNEFIFNFSGICKSK